MLLSVAIKRGIENNYMLILNNIITMVSMLILFAMGIAKFVNFMLDTQVINQKFVSLLSGVDIIFTRDKRIYIIINGQIEYLFRLGSPWVVRDLFKHQYSIVIIVVLSLLREKLWSVLRRCDDSKILCLLLKRGVNIDVYDTQFNVARYNTHYFLIHPDTVVRSLSNNKAVSLYQCNEILSDQDAFGPEYSPFIAFFDPVNQMVPTDELIERQPTPLRIYPYWASEVDPSFTPPPLYPRDD